MLFNSKFTALTVCTQSVDLLLIASGTPRVYTVAISVGHNNQNMNIQVDMGSSDLVSFVLFPLFTSCIMTYLSSPVLRQWLASKQCSSSACSSISGQLYDPSTGTSTNKQFSINYLEGSVSGPIYWDQVTIGGYTVPNQALGESRPFFYSSPALIPYHFMVFSRCHNR